MKKLLLFALLAPFTMQLEMAGANAGLIARTGGMIKDTAKNTYNTMFYHEKTDVVTLGLTFLAVLHNSLAPESPFKKYAAINDRLSFKNKSPLTLPYLLVIHEFINTILHFRKKNPNTVSAFLSALKLTSLIGLKLMPTATVNAAQKCGLYREF